MLLVDANVTVVHWVDVGAVIWTVMLRAPEIRQYRTHLKCDGNFYIIMFYCTFPMLSSNESI